jgi:hypothetical protein
MATMTSCTDPPPPPHPPWPSRQSRGPVTPLWALQTPLSLAPGPAPSSVLPHLWSDSIMARRLADLGTSRLAREQDKRPAVARSLSFGQPPLAPPSRLYRGEGGRRSLSAGRGGKGGQGSGGGHTERESVLHLLNLRLGGTRASGAGREAR